MNPLSANLRWLFLEWPFYERLRVAAQIGFRAVDFSLPYAYPAKELKARIDEHGLKFVYMLTPSGNWDAGELGIAALPGREGEFREGVRLALDYAVTLGCPLIHAASGIVPHSAGRARCRAIYLENLAYACDLAKASGVTIAMEPICKASHCEFLLNRTAEAIAIMDELGRDNLRLVYDTHHAAMEEGAVATTLENHLERIAHFQIANPPSRNEPGAGELDFDFLFDLLERKQFDGWISAEYKPTGTTLASLGWAKRFGIDAAQTV
ncbi:MAG: TIM barrel protein [Betaproteobacteria bacterium]|nr:TIM barrel protein [Betaproteobacteria bacterium]